MYKTIVIACGVVLLAVGLVLPLWYAAALGAVVLSLVLPFAGVFSGFLLDILYGAPPGFPALVAFPYTILACVVGLISLFVRSYLR